MRKSAKIPAAMAWLRSHMQPGKAYDSSDLLIAALNDGHALRTMQYASERLHVRKTRSYGDGSGVKRWVWTLPDEADEPSASPARQLVTT